MEFGLVQFQYDLIFDYKSVKSLFIIFVKFVKVYINLQRASSKMPDNHSGLGLGVYVHLIVRNMMRQQL